MNRILCAISKFLSSYCQEESLTPVVTASIDIAELKKLLRDKFPNSVVYLSDKEYNLAAYDDIALFLAQDETNKMGYVDQERDCDDFAYRLLGQFSVPGWSHLTFGMVWTYNHAFNIVVTTDKEILFVEPQTDELLSDLKEEWGLMRFIII